VGWNEGSITSSYSTGSVNGRSYVAGLVGDNYGGSITTSYSTGTVNGDDCVGGLLGSNYYGRINASYSTGTVTGIENIGGLVGGNRRDNAIVSTCLWDTETSGLLNMCGIQDYDASGCDNSYGKTTAEMQTAHTFLEAGWDFVDETANGTEDIWWILEGQDYPRLWWELIPEN
jgi:hypothetical protein